MKNNTKKLIKLTVAMAVLVILFFAFSSMLGLISRINKIKINIVVAPKDAVVMIDGAKVRAGENYVSIGKHKIVVEKEHFSRSEQTVDISPSNTLIPPIALNPADSIGQTMKKNYRMDYIEVDGEGSRQYDIQSEKLYKKYPILKKLPVNFLSLFCIDHGASKKYPNDPQKIAIFIKANSPKTRQNALYYMYNMGYDPSDYEIIFKPLGIDK